MSNLRARKAMERAQQLLREHPSAAKKASPPVTAIWCDGLQCEMSHREGHKVVTDMASTLGGDGTGPSPGWLLRASLAACTATAIAMRAAMANIELRKLQVSVHGEVDTRAAIGIDGVSLAMTGMRMSIMVGANNAPESHLREIAEWGATQSTVSSTLRERPSFEVSIV
jgi:uncharacterized OsmC-like protein